MTRTSRAMIHTAILIAFPICIGFVLWLLQAKDDLGSYMAFAVFIAIPIEFLGESVYLRRLKSRTGVLGRRRSRAEVAGVLGITVSLVFVEAACISPNVVGDWLLYSWRAGGLVLVCLVGLVGVGFGKGGVRITALLCGLATLMLWYMLAMAP